MVLTPRWRWSELHRCGVNAGVRQLPFTPAVVLTAIASSKSTVLGLRLDHDRRAWIEDTAAQQGVSVRAVFEALIDRARAEEAAFNSFLVTDDPRAGRNGHDVAPGVDGVAGPEDAFRGATPDGFAAGSVPAALASMAVVGRALALSGRVLGMAVSLATALVENSGHYARENWRIITRAQQ
jgi:hypothetical protein